MDALDVSRWQFGITTVYHFIFVPLTIGLAPLIADHADDVGGDQEGRSGIGSRSSSASCS